SPFVFPHQDWLLVHFLHIFAAKNRSTWVSVASSRRSGCFPRAVLGAFSFAGGTPAAVVCGHFRDPRDLSAFRRKHGDGLRSLPDFPAGGAAGTSHDSRDAAGERSRIHTLGPRRSGQFAAASSAVRSSPQTAR